MFGYSGKLLLSSPQKRDTFSTLCRAAVLYAVGKAGNVPYRPGTRCCNKCAENVDQEEKFTTHAEYKPKEAQFRFWVVHNF